MTKRWKSIVKPNNCQSKRNKLSESNTNFIFALIKTIIRNLFWYNYFLSFQKRVKNNKRKEDNIGKEMSERNI